MFGVIKCFQVHGVVLRSNAFGQLGIESHGRDSEVPVLIGLFSISGLIFEFR